MDILKKIEKLRDLKGWSNHKLAEESLLTPSTLNNMFYRRTMPSISTLSAICDGLEISLAEFFADDCHFDFSPNEIELILNFRKLSNKNKVAVKNLIEDLV